MELQFDKWFCILHSMCICIYMRICDFRCGIFQHILIFLIILLTFFFATSCLLSNVKKLSINWSLCSVFFILPNPITHSNKNFAWRQTEYGKWKFLLNKYIQLNWYVFVFKSQVNYTDLIKTQYQEERYYKSQDVSKRCKNWWISIYSPSWLIDLHGRYVAAACY